jgi:hypothetical protein
MSTGDSGSGVREVKVAALFRIYVLDRERKRTRFLTVAALIRFGKTLPEMGLRLLVREFPDVQGVFAEQ